MTISCDQLDSLLPAVFGGGLSVEDEAAAAEHLATCNHCRVTVSDLEHVGDLGRRHGKLELPLEAKVRIRALLGDA
jgi:anti-sigma factor RsiW